MFTPGPEKEGIIAYTYGYKTQMMLPRNPALTSSQADEPCNKHHPEGLLRILNNLTGYNFDLDEPNLETGLQILISGNHDVGKGYAWFRTAFVFTFNGGYSRPGYDEISPDRPFTPVLIAWYPGLPDITNCDSSLTSLLRPGTTAVDQGETVVQPVQGDLRIVKPERSHPRRLWDTLANRVIPHEWHARTTRVFGLNMPEAQERKFPLAIIPGTQFPNPEPLPPSFTEFRAQYTERAAKWRYYAFQRCVPYTAISHSWAARLRYTITPVNEQMWPVPLPEDISLEEIRQNLLSFRFPNDRYHRACFWQVCPPPYEVEYCWLDILCLRLAWTTSKGTLVTSVPAGLDYTELENTRLQEWKLDVPIIGSVYQRSCDILMYLNGIGKTTVTFAESDWDSPYHWMNRAWTLQEYKTEGIVIRNGEQPESSQRIRSSALNALLLNLPVSGCPSNLKSSNFPENQCKFEICPGSKPFRGLLASICMLT